MEDTNPNSQNSSDEGNKKFPQPEAGSVNFEYAKSFFEYLSKSIAPIDDPIKEQYEIVAPLLRQTKMWYFPSMPIHIHYSLYELTKQESNISSDQVEKIFIDYYDEFNCANLKRMVTSWFSEYHFQQRMHIIEDALEAHVKGKYTLSIPSLLPQVEGILSSVTGQTAGSPEKLLKTAVELDFHERDHAYGSLSDQLLTSLASDPFLFKGGLGVFFTPEKYNEWRNSQGLEMLPLNRHAILHGVQFFYSSKMNSLRTFFLLDSISEIAKYAPSHGSKSG